MYNFRIGDFNMSNSMEKKDNSIINNINIIYKNQLYTSSDYMMFVQNFTHVPHKRTILLMKRNQELLYAILYLFFNKQTYIPIDPLLPLERIQYIIKDTNADFIFNNSDINFDITKESDLRTEDAANLEKIAYILYTSGSTGNPKGVEIKREALFNFMEAVSEIIDFSAGKRIACLTTVSFDIFFLESIMAIYKGLTVVLATEEEQKNPKLMARFIQNNAVDMVQMTPSRMQLLLNYDKELSCLKNVKEIMIGGEPFPPNLLHALQENTTAKIYNMYGPTETTIWSTISDLTCKDQVDIGYPLKNTEIYIIDENLLILPQGEIGEICIAGKGLAKGYIGQKDLTAEKFIYLPQKENTRVYRTGDRGRFSSDGSLVYSGREDNQVKIRGYRIELEEIESNLNQFIGIKQSVVAVSEKNGTDKILQAFYTSDIVIQQRELSDFLSSKLPDYMIPVTFKRVESFIQTENGKIDRSRILECEDKTLNNFIEENVKELSDIQKHILDIIVFNLNLPIENITLDTDFLSIGVDSVSFIQMVIALENEFNFNFDDEMLLISSFPTFNSIIEYIKLKTMNGEN